MNAQDAPAFPSASMLTGHKLAEYHAAGFLIVRQVFEPAEVALMAMEADRLLDRKELKRTNNLRCRWQSHCESGECLFEAFDPVIDLSPLLATVARDPRLLRTAADIYGEPAHLFKDKLIFKPPGAKGYDLHQDFIGWPAFPESFLTAALAIDSCDPENGCTEVFPTLHTQGYLSPRDGDYHALAEEVIAGVDAVPLTLEPGDVAFFGAFTPHRSSPNRSPNWRRLLYLSFNRNSDGGDQRDAHYVEFRRWLRVKYAEYGKHDLVFE